METEGGVEKQRTVFPHLLAKRLLAFRTVPTGSTVVSPQTTKPDISLATNTGHFYLLPTLFYSAVFMAASCVTSAHAVELRSRREADGWDGLSKILHIP